MTMLVVFAFAVLALASASFTRLIVKDRISLPLRRGLISKLGQGHWLVYLIHCPYCTSMWTSLLATLYWVLLTGVSWWWFPPAAFGMRYLVAPILLKFDQED